VFFSNAAENELLRCNLLPAVTVVPRVKPRYGCGACKIKMHAVISGMGHDIYTQSLCPEVMGVFF
jgi:hypothetical protein